MEAYIFDHKFQSDYYDRKNMIFDLAGIPELNEILPFPNKDFDYQTQIMILEYYMKTKALSLYGEIDEVYEKMDTDLIFELYSLTGHLLFVSSSAKKFNSVLDMAFDVPWKDLYSRSARTILSLNKEVVLALAQVERGPRKATTGTHRIYERHGNFNTINYTPLWGWKVTKKDSIIPAGVLVISRCEKI